MEFFFSFIWLKLLTFYIFHQKSYYSIIIIIYIYNIIKKLSEFLSSREASLQVLSAFTGLTSGFGMGPGVPPQLFLPSCVFFSSNRHLKLYSSLRLCAFQSLG